MKSFVQGKQKQPYRHFVRQSPSFGVLISKNMYS
jgi:hypothetical protein